MSLISLSAHDVDAAGLGLEAELPPAWLDAELADASVTARAPGHLTARLSRTGNEIVVRGRVRAALTLPCARCTQPATLDVDTELSLLLQPAPHAPPASPKHAAAKAAKAAKATAGKGDAGKAGAGKPAPAKPRHAKDEEYEFTSAEADVDAYDGETVVLDAFVREAILLEVPNFPLCSEACPGIRPAAEPAPKPAEPTLDPRLSPLAALRAKLARADEAGAVPPPKAPAAGSPRPKPKKNKE